MTRSVHQIVTVNLDFLSLAQREANFRETINQADLVVATVRSRMGPGEAVGAKLSEEAR